MAGKTAISGAGAGIRPHLAALSSPTHLPQGGISARATPKPPRPVRWKYQHHSWTRLSTDSSVGTVVEATSSPWSVLRPYNRLARPTLRPTMRVPKETSDAPVSTASVGVEDRIRAVCACPVCKGPLTWAVAQATCDACDAVYEINEGVPVLFPAENRPPVANPDEDALAGLSPRLRRYAERFRRHKPELTYKSPATRHLAAHYVEALGMTASVFNIGSGTSSFGPSVVNVDIAPNPGVSIVGTCERLPLRSEIADGIVLQAVLEHVQDVSLALDEAHRVLRNGASLYVEVPFVAGYHPTPADYRRWTRRGIEEELREHGFSPVEGGVVVGPASATAWILADFLALALSLNNVRAYRVIRLATRVLVVPLKYLDRYLESHPLGDVICGGVWIQATRE